MTSKTTTEAAQGETADGALSGANATEPRREAMTLDAALQSLDDENDAHWLRDGSPRMAVIEELTGDTSITKAQVAASPAYRTRASAGSDVEPTAPAPDAADGRRIQALEDDIAFLRQTYSWPTKS